VNENSNVADRVRVEVMELKPVEIKKATSCFTRMRSGAAEKGGEIQLAWGLSKEVKVELGSGWGFRNYSAD
jgi:hypothetical protein